MVATAPPRTARHLKISGRVQGVWYRNWTVETARTLGLVGWVCNCMDGCVEAWVEGPEDTVADFLVLAHQGPPAARVSHISVEDGELQGFTTFEKRPTR